MVGSHFRWEMPGNQKHKPSESSHSVAVLLTLLCGDLKVLLVVIELHRLLKIYDREFSAAVGFIMKNKRQQKKGKTPFL